MTTTWKMAIVLATTALAVLMAAPAAEAFPEPSGHVRIVVDEDRSIWYDCTYRVSLSAGSDVDCAAG
jgi:hypothetical protein